MAITQFTTLGSVRAVLGVSDEELEDSTLEAEIYSLQLERNLRSISVTLPEDYAAARDASSPSAAETLLVSRVRIFSTLSVAYLVGSALPLLAAKDISDGKASTARFAGAPFESVLRRVGEDYAAAREELQAIAQPGLAVASTVSLLRAVGAAVDPVTGS